MKKYALLLACFVTLMFISCTTADKAVVEADTEKETVEIAETEVVVPETVPAENVTIKATWTINSYKLTYKVDGSVYKEYTLNYGNAITPEAEPTKEGYTFSGWSEIPSTMPAHNVEVNGSFNVNYYKVLYYVDEELVHVGEAIANMKRVNHRWAEKLAEGEQEGLEIAKSMVSKDLVNPKDL